MRKIFLLLIIVITGFAANGQVKNSSMLKAADSLFSIKQWKAAKEIYVRNLLDNSKYALALNRLGYFILYLG